MAHATKTNASKINGAAKRTPAQEAAIRADLEAQAKLREGMTIETETCTLKIDTPQPAAAPVAEEGLNPEKLRAAVIEGLMKVFGVDENAPSWKRKLAAAFASLVLVTGASYAIGTLAGYAITGIAALGGSVLWSYLLMVTAIIVSLYAGFKIGKVVGNYILSGQIDEDCSRLKNKVTGWFKRDKKAPALAAAS